MADPAPAQPAPPTAAKPRTGFGLLAVKVVFIALWIFWGYSVVRILVTSILAHRGHPENYLAAVAFLPAVVFTLLNGYWLTRKASTLPLPALCAWTAGLTSHGQTTLGPVIGLVCFFLDPINPFTFAVIRVARPLFRQRRRKVASDR